MEDAMERLTEAIREAGKAVYDADLPEEFRKAAFERALSVTLGRSGLMGAAESAPPEVTGMQGPPAAGSDSQARDPLKLIAARAGVTVDEVKEIFSVEGEDVNVVVGARRIDQQSAGGSKQLTLLLAGARQAAGFEEWTPLRKAREVCELYGRLDSKNYAAVVVRGMDSAFSFRGSGVSREVRLTMPGWDDFADLVRLLLGQGGGA